MASGLITEYLGEGLTAARPATPDIPSGAIALYYSTDDNEMSAYADGAWIEDVFGTGGALLVANNLSDLASASTARTNLGLAIGTDVQAYDADLADIAGLADAQGDIIIRGASGWERLAAGTDGQVLTTGGAGANPAWEDAAGGGDLGALHLYEERPSGSDAGNSVATTWIARLLNTTFLNTISGASRVTSTVTVTIASPGVFTWVAHGLANGSSVTLTTTGALPTGLSANVTYYVVSAATDTFSLATTPGGAAINTSGSQSGTHTAHTGEISLPAGTYDIHARAPCLSGGSTGYKARLYDKTGAATLIEGTSMWATGSSVEQECRVQGRFTLGSTSVVRIEMHATAARTSGWGVNAAITGVSNHFTDVFIRRIS